MKLLSEELGRRMKVIDQLKKNNDLINKTNKENLKKIEELNKEKKKII